MPTPLMGVRRDSLGTEGLNMILGVKNTVGLERRVSGYTSEDNDKRLREVLANDPDTSLNHETLE